MQVIVDGLLTNYSEIGKGKRVILCLHGWADTGVTFEGLGKDLIKHGDFRLIMIDLPGFGGTQNPPAAWGLDDYVGFIESFLKKIKTDPHAIIAHSNGGAIAVTGLASNHFKAEKLVLLASAGIRNPSLKKLLLKAFAKPAGLALKAFPKTVRLRVRKKLYGTIGSDYLVVMHMQDTFKRVVSTDVSEAASTLELPVCLIYGERDDATPPELGRKLAGVISGAEFYEIPLAGHFVHHEQVYKVSNIIKDFLK